MIPVSLQPEPADFDTKVRKKGLKWLRDNNILLNKPPPETKKLPNYWTYSNKQLWETYSRTCAYLAIQFEWTTGAASTDHFVPKSRNAGAAYEWSNYRLSCLGPNRNKSNFEDILDPIGLAPYTFVLNFSDGCIYPNTNLDPDMKKKAQETIARLKLDSPENNEMRARHYQEYAKGECTLNYIKKWSPFVYSEIVRQEL